MNKDEMISYLREGMCRVTFTKKDGTERKMLATLEADRIPDDKKPKGVKSEQPNDSPIIRAYDLALGEFRSINSETVTDFLRIE